MLIYYLIYIVILVGFLMCYYKPEYTISVMWVYCIILTLLAGLRGLGSDHDMNNYLLVFDNVYEYGDTAFINMDPMAVWLPVTMKKLGIYSLTTIFFCFAIIGVVPQFKGMLKYSPLPVLSCLIFYSFIYFKQEFNQIRAGVAAALFMWAIQDVLNRNLKLFLIKIIVASQFHLSAILYLPTYLFSTTKLNKKVYLLVLSFIVLIAALKINLLGRIPGLSSISAKIDTYVELSQRGIGGENNILSIGNLINLTITFLLIISHDSLVRYSKSATIFIKLNFVAIASFAFIGTLSNSIAGRIYELFLSPALIAMVYLIYIIKPKWMAVALLVAYGIYFMIFYSANGSLLYSYQLSI